MTIAELGSLGEFVGSVILIVSVLYLAIQVRLSAKAENNAAMQNILAASSEANHRIADNPEFAELVVKVTRDPESISESERLRLNVRWIALYHHLDGAYHMHKAGQLNVEIWAKFDFEAPLWISTLPWCRSWYETDKQRLSPSFRAYLDARLLEMETPDVIPTVGLASK